MPLNRDVFFSKYRDAFGPVHQEQVDALNQLLDFIEADSEWRNGAHVSYVLATCKHETANTFKPIAEYGHGRGHSYGQPDPETGQTYYGRGYVQLTWKKNYQHFATELGIDLVNDPDGAMQPGIAYRIMSDGMRKGSFTGKKLDDYFTVEVDGFHNDWRNARRIINGLDRADLIAGYGEWFLKILQAASQPVGA